MEMDTGDRETGSVLESALIDQRMRADRHRANFESLKAQHLILQEAHNNLKLEFESLSESYDRLHHKSQDIIRTLQKERDDKIIECEELKPQILTSLKLEQLRRQLADELEEPCRKQLTLLESELETLKSEHSKLKYDYAFLKSEHQATLVTHQSVIQELSVKHDTQLSALIQEKKALLARQERDVPTDLQRIRQLQRDNSELQQKVAALTCENEELVAQKEYSEIQSGQNHQEQSRQLAELQAQLKTKELECSSQDTQLQSLQLELNKAHHHSLTLNDQLTQSHREVSNYKRKLEELEHQNNMEASNLKMKHAEQFHKLEQEREQYAAEWQAGQTQLHALQKALEEYQLLLADKEHEAEQRVQGAREKEWEKIVNLEREKVELEEKITKVQRCQMQNEEDCKLKVQKLEGYVHQLQSSKSELESEIEIAKVQYQEKAQQLQSLSTEIEQLSRTSKKYQALLTEHGSLQQSERELLEVQRKLEATVHLLEEHLNKAHEDIQRMQEQYKQELERERQLCCEEKQVLSSRLEERQAEQQALSGQLTDTNKTNKKIQKHYRKQIQELQQSMEVLRAKVEKMQTEKEALMKASGLENKKLKQKIAEMQRKHKEFLFVLHHVEPASSSTALETGLRATTLQRHKTDQESEWKRLKEEEIVAGTDAIAAAVQQHQLVVEQQAGWMDTHHLAQISPSHSENSIEDSQR